MPTVTVEQSPDLLRVRRHSLPRVVPTVPPRVILVEPTRLLQQKALPRIHRPQVPHRK